MYISEFKHIEKEPVDLSKITLKCFLALWGSAMAAAILITITK
jgi:hypothetical protein